MKFFVVVQPVPRTKLLDFGGNLDHDPDPGALVLLLRQQKGHPACKNFAPAPLSHGS